MIDARHLTALMAIHRELLVVHAELAIMVEAIEEMRAEASPALQAVIRTRSAVAKTTIARVVTDLKGMLPS